MPKRPRRSRDPVQAAHQVYLEIIGEVPPPEPEPEDPLKAAAAELGRRGGLKGGKIRAANLPATRRSEIARKAARARWDKRHD